MLTAHTGNGNRAGVDAEAISKAGDLQSAIFNSASFSCIATDALGVIQVFNVGAERMLGYSSADVLNSMTPADISDPEELSARAAALRVEFGTAINSELEALACKASRGIEDIYELTYICKDRRRFPAVVSVTALRDARQAVIGYLLIGTDNTARKRLDVERTQLEQQLRDREVNDHRLHLAAIVDCSNDAIIGKTLKGVITSWNEGAHRIFGYSDRQMLGQPASRLVPADRQAEEPVLLRKVSRGERVEPFDTVRLREDGRELHVSVTISPVRNTAGALIGASMIVRDVSERHRTEEDLLRAREAAEAACRELEAFSYSVAHDLRAPLRGMSGFAHVLLEKYRDKLDADGQDWLQEIALNAGKMGALIDALLSLSQLTKHGLCLESVDMSSLVRATAGRLAAMDPDRSVELIVEDHLTATMDPVLARALIENLLSNAWKFTSKVLHARVEFGLATGHGAGAFFVRDNGVGFDMTFADKLFGHFQRLHAAADFPGTGIGLATVQRIALRHEGRAWAIGSVNGGATFYFSVPVRTPGAVR